MHNTTIEEILAILENDWEPIELSRVEELVLCQAWEGKTYAKIAEQAEYNPDHIKSVGSQLWRRLSKVLGEPVTKHNFRSVLKRRARQLQINSAQFETPSSSLKIDREIREWGDGEFQDFITYLKQIMSNPQTWVESLPPCFFGRVEELAILKKWIVEDRCRSIAVLGMEGVGKTALTVRCVEQIQGEFEYVIWRSLHRTPSIDELLADWLHVLSQGRKTDLPEPTEDRISLLLAYLQQHRCLLIIDRYESMSYSDNSNIKISPFPSKESEGDRSFISYNRYSSTDGGYAQLLRRLGTEHHQSCLLLTSRKNYPELAFKENNNSPIRALKLTGLGAVEAREILRVAGLWSSDAVCDRLIDRYAGNPLALKIVATVIRDLFDQDVAQFLARDTFIFNKLSNLSEQPLTHLPPLDMAS